MVATSFKIDTQWFAWPPVYFPDPPTLANYLNVWFGDEEYTTTQYAISLAEAADLAAQLASSSPPPRRSSPCCSAR